MCSAAPAHRARSRSAASSAGSLTTGDQSTAGFTPTRRRLLDSRGRLTPSRTNCRRHALLLDQQVVVDPTFPAGAVLVVVRHNLRAKNPGSGHHRTTLWQRHLPTRCWHAASKPVLSVRSHHRVCSTEGTSLTFAVARATRSDAIACECASEAMKAVKVPSSSRAESAN